MAKAESPLTRLSAFFFRHRWLKLVLLVAVPLAWLVGVFLAITPTIAQRLTTGADGRSAAEEPGTLAAVAGSQPV